MDLDPQALNLAKSIRRAETGTSSDPYNAKGKSGEFGAYQFMPETYKGYAKKYLGDENAKPTVENQNKIAYSFIKEKKDSGFNPAQIASMWNAGEGNPDAYKNGLKGTNAKGVAFDVPAYVSKVSQFYREMGAQTPQAPQSPQSVQEPKKGFLQRAGDVVNTIFPGEKIGQSIGTLGGYLASNNKELYDTSAPSPLQVAGDVAQSALTIGAGAPAKAVSVFDKTVPLVKTASTALGRIGQGAAVGAGIAGTGAVAEGKDIGEVAKDAAVGSAVGGALGGVGEILTKASQTLPQRFLKGVVPGINDETANYAVNKGLGSPEKMLSESEKSIKTFGSQLGSTLKSKKYTGVSVTGQDIVDDVIKRFPDAQLTPEAVWAEVKNLARLKAGLVTKLERGGVLSLSELHSLNSVLGGNTFKTMFDDPAVKAGKEIGSAVYHSISDRIKTIAPETIPIFENLSKEYPLRNALFKAVRRGEKRKFLTLRELVAITSGLSLAGPVGGITGLVGEKLIQSPTANLQVANLIKKLGSQTATQAIKPLVLRQVDGE